jgi:hypothetical protein
MRTFDSDLLEVLEATDGRSDSGALFLEAFHHGLLAPAKAFPIAMVKATAKLTPDPSPLATGSELAGSWP